MLTVVMAAHDAAPTIRAAVDSVLRQAGVELQLVVVDDGSADATAEQLATVEDPRLSVVSGPHAGPAAARNRGLARARGEVVAFLDADDVWLPGTGRAYCDAFRRTPDAALAYGWTDHVDPHGRVLCPDRRVAAEGDVYGRILTHNFIDTLSAVAVRSRVLDEVGGFDETLPVLEDWDLYVRLAARHPFTCVSRVVARYRRSPGSLSGHVLTMATTHRRAVARAFAAAPAVFQHLQPRNVALFHEYLATRTTQGPPSRTHGRLAARFFVTAVRTRPANLLTLWQRPWVVKALLKALLWTATGPTGEATRRPP